MGRLSPGRPLEAIEDPGRFNLRLDGPTRSGEAARIDSGAEGNPDLSF